MNSLLHSLFLLSFSMIFGVTNAQNSTSHDLLHEHEGSFFTHSKCNVKQKKDFSYFLINQAHDDIHIGHLHEETVVLMDLISSESSSDFNCSGGFCMTTSHFHKKGLTSQKQLFEYFMSITC